MFLSVVAGETMKSLSSLFLSISAVYAGAVFGAEDQESSHGIHTYEEEIIVSAPFQRNEAKTALPINVLTQEALRREVEDELGATLKNQIGIHNTSYGPGVGQAVIRGQSGTRVQVLQNSVSNVDVAAVSPDHTNGVEPALASRIEVIRGPATLLYGNGAVGGIVNVIDERILEASLDKPEFAIVQSRNSVNEGDKTVAKFNGSLGFVNLHLDAFTRDNNDVDINGFAIDETALERLEEAQEGEAHEGEAHEDDEHAGHEEEEITNTKGYISNSDAKSDGYTIGTSVSGEKGFIGISVASLESNYGLPGGTHSHHHEEEHGDEHADEHGDEEGEEEEEGEEFVRIDMAQTRYDLKGEYRFEEGFLQRVQASLNYTDYEHSELEIEADGTAFVGSVYSNEGYEGRFTATHNPIGQLQGVWGLQLSDTEFSALGAEAFIPKTESTGFALFAVERLDTERVSWEFGYRYGYNETDPGEGCDRDESTHSLSASMLYDLNASSNILIALSSSERAPTLEERYSNVQTASCTSASDPEDLVAHVATGRLEIGNANLDKEKATNIEVGFRQHSGKLTGEFSVYYNEIDDYIFLEDSGEFEEQIISSYVAQDATFYGVEGRLAYTAWQSAYGELDLTLQGDIVKASFDRGGDVPRIPPARIGIGMAWHANAFSIKLNLTEVSDQKDTAAGEFETKGYADLALYADYHLDLIGGELLFYAKGTNLLDEEIRNHTSFLKNFAPEAGRGVRIGVRYTY
ncbi:MAG: iron complex outermembrane receptor protein [Candidatus Azotimanducaceae bacterium]|jgi:iron complex outermembrane receptor protein